MPPVGIGAVLYGRYVKRLSKQAQASLGEAVGVASERLSAVRTVKLCNAEEREQQRFNEKVDDIYTDLADGIVRSVASSEIVVGGSPCREMSTVRGAAAELPAPRTASRFSVLSVYALSHTHRNVCLTPTLVHSTLTL